MTTTDFTYFTAAGPQDPDVITGPWWPRHDETVDELIARSRKTCTDLAAAVERSRRARGADVTATVIVLREVA